MRTEMVLKEIQNGSPRGYRDVETSESSLSVTYPGTKTSNVFRLSAEGYLIVEGRTHGDAGPISDYKTFARCYYFIPEY